MTIWRTGFGNTFLKYPTYIFICVAGGILLLAGCGGGNSGSYVPPSQPADFTVSATPASLILLQGQQNEISVSLAPKDGFNATASVQVASLPTGVTASPQTFSLQAGSSQSVTLTASPAADPESVTVSLTANSGTLTHSTSFGLSVLSAAVARYAPIRTRYIRTDEPYRQQWFHIFPQQVSVYDQPSRRFFVSSPSLNLVSAFDAATQTKLADIVVPAAWVMDDSPLDGHIYVGTYLGDIYVIDPVALAVIQHIPAANIGPSGFASYEVRPMADGQWLLVSGMTGDAVDGFAYFGVYDPKTGALSVYGTPQGSDEYRGGPITTICPTAGLIGQIALTADRRRIVLTSADSDGTLCIFDPATQQQNYAQFSDTSDMLFPADGKEILMPTDDGVLVVDINTLSVVDSFSFQSKIPGGPLAAIYCVLSRDSNTVYMVQGPQAQAYDWKTHVLKGWFASSTFFGTMSYIVPQAVDETGLLFGPVQQGVGFMDASTLQSGIAGPVYSGIGTAGVTVPSVASLSGGLASQTSFWTIPMPAGKLYFGIQPAADTSLDPTFALIKATVPAGFAGPVDVTYVASDGSVQMAPETFSYGPWIVDATESSGSTAEGGGVGTIYGYGFGPLIGELPSDLQVTVAGHTVPIVSYNPQEAVQSYAVPIQTIRYTIPPGSVGQTADVVVTNSSGTTTAKGALQYFAPVQTFPLPGASLLQGVYDPHRDVYYFTDQSKIQVFSKSKKQWLTPIPINPPAGAAASRLYGISLSPDGTKLAVSDTAASAIYVLNPTSPSNVTTYLTPNTGLYSGAQPGGLAISDRGLVYFFTYYSYNALYGFHCLDTSTGLIADYPYPTPLGGAKDAYVKLQLLQDNSRVFLTIEGMVAAIDTATNQILYTSPAVVGGNGGYELAISPDQTTIMADGFFLNPSLNPQSSLALNQRQTWYVNSVSGSKLSHNGDLLFAPQTQEMDVIDTHSGTLVNRIGLPVTLSSGYDALVTTDQDKVLLAITSSSGDGVAMLDLSAIPDPVVPPYLKEHSVGRVNSVSNNRSRRANSRTNPH